jgi:hypothetical protein
MPPGIRMRGRGNCNVNLDQLRWDRLDLGCEPLQARGIRCDLQLDATTVKPLDATLTYVALNLRNETQRHWALTPS